jgi:PPM family protein phosphatase
VTLKFGFNTDTGRKRHNNQDSFVIVRGETLNGELDALFVIADGMGGTQGGEVASDIVVRTLPEVVTAYLAARNGDKSPVDAGQLIEGAILEAHRRVQQRQTGDTQLSGMGTTCVAAILDANVLTIGNVGDSRAYLLRDGRLKQITQDHSSVWEQVLAGNMTPEEARTSRFRNQITRAVGSEFNAEPDIDIVELQEGDSVLLCSDGLTTEIDDDEIARLLAGVADPQAACDKLVDAALGAGGKDNVTVVALRYGEFKPVLAEKKPLVAPKPADDPTDAWREAGFEPRGQRGGSDPEFDTARRSSGRRGASPVLLALLFVLAVLAGGEAYALLRLNQGLEALRKTLPKIVTVPQPRPTDNQNLSYGEPATILAKEVRDMPLAVDDEGSALAATANGNLVRIDRGGHLTKLPDQSKVPAGSTAPGQESLLLATDVSGYRYQVNPGAKVISKYDPEGRLMAASICKGKLVRPTALVVDPSGNLYVIDDHRVKKITASDAPPAPDDAPPSR